MAIYGLVQFIGLLFVTSFFLFTWDAISKAGDMVATSVYLGMAGYIIFSIYSLGTGYEGRSSFYRNETLRILALTALSIMGWWMDIYTLPALIWLVFSVISLIWLLSLRRKKTI